MSKLVLIEHHDEYTLITLNRPAKRNALNRLLLEQLCQAFHETALMPDQRAIILTGADPIFCAGMDLLEASLPENLDPLAHLIADALTAIYTSPLVTIAAVNGAAIAGGAGLMSACDFVVAASNAKIGYPEIKHGLVAAQVATLLARQVSWRKMRELLLLGELLDANQAQAIGLINDSVSPELLMSKAVELAQLISKRPLEAVVETKKLLYDLDQPSLQEDLLKVINIRRKAGLSNAAKSGIAKFLNKESQ